MNNENKEALFSLNNVCKYFPAKNKALVKAIDGVSFDINKGETFSLVGESGCGKTTCGRLLLRIYNKTGGDILYKGEPIEKLNREEIKKFQKNNQMIFQDPYSCLDPRMALGTIIQEGMNVHYRLSASEREEKVYDLLTKVGLTHEFASRFPHEISGGQRQRIGIARAMATNPEFIVCDEPIAALDVSIQAQVINLMIKLQQEEHLTYLFISHDLSMVKHISDRIGVMYLGSMVEQANTDDLYSRPLHPYTKALFSAIPRVDFSGSKSNRIKLTGEIPSPINSPKGCKFCTRCMYAGDECRESAPELKEIEKNHFVACHKTCEIN